MPAVAKRPPLAPPPPPRDIAVFVKGPGNEGCAGVVWLHVDYRSGALHGRRRAGAPRLRPARRRSAAARRDRRPGGAQGRATAPSGDRLSVTFGSWITVDPLAVRAALPGFVTMPTPPAPAGGAAPRCLGDGPVADPRAAAARCTTCAVVLKNGLADQLNLVGFVNYILGSTRREHRAQAAGRFDDRRGPRHRRSRRPRRRARCRRRVDRRGRYQRWLPATDAAARPAPVASPSTRASPVYEPTVQRRPAGHTVVVLTSPLGRYAAAYRAAFARALRVVRRARRTSCACAPARARPRSAARSPSRPTAAPLGSSWRWAGRERRPSRRPAGRRSRRRSAGVRTDALPAVVSEAPGAGAAVNQSSPRRPAAPACRCRRSRPRSPRRALRHGEPVATPTAGATPTPGATPAAGATRRAPRRRAQRPRPREPTTGATPATGADAPPPHVTGRRRSTSCAPAPWSAGAGPGSTRRRSCAPCSRRSSRRASRRRALG